MLNLRNNSLVGSLPSALGTYPRLSAVDLSDNSLYGPLQAEIGNLGRLKLLNLAKNKLSGHLPNELKKLVGLEYLDLSNNNFNGQIPDKLPSTLMGFNVSKNNLSGNVPENLTNFLDSSKSNTKIAIIVSSVVAAVMIAFILLAYYRGQLQDFRVRSGFSAQPASRDGKVGRFGRPSLFKFQSNAEPPPTSLSFSNDHLLTSNSRSLSGQKEFVTEIVEHVVPAGTAATSASANLNLLDSYPATSGRKSSSGSSIASSPRFVEAIEQPVTLNVYSPDRLAGELFFLDNSLVFTAEELSRAPAEVLGRSSHGTLYKATLGSGHMLTVKWLRVGLVKHKKEFAKEVKKISAIRHPNVVQT
ncbi:putative inactive receptor kinase [Heracleum sosnowskyi]|uniref:Inactive receptor kinase n=1 Tax=Heracleum sosnowskyi TaxID=360622 RepID=A0AAD8N404_9APIA|nr:putative inactive receptor kinase [Heracleum sosnowskyi]